MKPDEELEGLPIPTDVPGGGVDEVQTEPSDWREVVDESSEEDDVLIEGVNDAAVYDPSVDISTLPLEKLSREQMIERARKLEESNNSLKNNTDSNALVNARFAELAETLKKSVTPQPVQPVQPTETEEQFNERIRELMHDDPVKAQDELMKRRMGPIFTTLAGNNVQNSRALLMLDPTEGELARRYQDKLDAKVNALPDWQKLQDPNIYRKMLNEVKAEELPTLIAEQAAKMAEEILKKQGIDAKLVQKGTTPPTAKATVNVNPRPAVRQYSDPGYSPGAGAAAGQKKIIGKLTKAEADYAVRVKGITPAQYYKILQRQGVKP